MNRNLKTFSTGKVSVEKALKWVSVFETGAFFHSNFNTGQYWNWLAAVSPLESIEAPAGQAFELLRNAINRTHDWWFGFLSYDLKNEVERLSSNHPDHIQWPHLYFFRPQIIIGQRDDTLYIYTDDSLLPESVWEQLCATETEITRSDIEVTLNARWDKETYCLTVDHLKKHIIDGDIYEINLCRNFMPKTNPYSR